MNDRIYRASRDIPIRGTCDGKPAVSTIPEGSIAIPVRTATGDEGMLVEGAIIPVSWNSEFFSFIFAEA